MLVYFALLIVICLDFLIEHILNKKGVLSKETWFSKFLNIVFKFRILSIAGMVFLSTFRALSVGGDTVHYSNFFINLRNNNVSWSKYEVGYTFLNYIFTITNFDARIIFFITSLIVSFCFVLFVNKFSSNKLMSLLLYVMFGILGQSLSALRQFIAISFILLALIFIADKKLWQSIILLICASMFHVSAMLCLIIIPIRYIKLNKWWLICSFVLVCIISLGLPFVLKIVETLIPSFNYYTIYFVKDNFFKPTNLFNILYSLGMIAIFAVLYLARFKWFKDELENDKYYTFFLSLFLIVPLIRIAGFIVGLEALLNRINMYFFFLLIVLVPRFLSCFKNFNHNEWLVAMTYIGAIIYMILIYAVHDSCSVTPYIFWF